MHGYGGDASWHSGYSEMDDYAIPQNIAVVYPEGLLNSWNVGGFWENNNFDDVGFISVLIDSVSAQFSIDLDRVYACGFSNGGYMAYELACELSDKIAAFGSVTGNFLLNDDQVCDQSRKIPIIDFHGTEDTFVSYDVDLEDNLTYNDNSLLFDENLAYWMNFNGLTEMTIEEIPNIDLLDGSWVEKYTVSGENTNAQFVHFRVYNGGHQWFGSTTANSYIGYLGTNNHDINANEELISFFLQFRLSDLIPELNNDNPILPRLFNVNPAHPNPFNPLLNISFYLQENSMVKVVIIDLNGKEVETLLFNHLVAGSHQLNWNAQKEPSGVYFVKLTAGNYKNLQKVILLK
ncbi:MAG: T9SS type A sorting domain-containing protein [Candidatus Marinimicrobia bacterium]|nr:T9SS type A sorting domain-containing protein [Candidatus Neomarinimicrobiota bacterium]